MWPRATLPRVTSSRAEAQALCDRLSRTHYENFPVAGVFAPRACRRSLRAIYAYCRSVDDLGDEAEGDRLTLLDAWEEALERTFRGDPPGGIFPALLAAIRRHDLPAEPFRRLVEANRIDQRKTRHATYAELLDYCAHSANPVGHLVLRVWGVHDARREGLSDAICTALQLTNFWQDVARDWERGRLYIPGEDLGRFGVSEQDVACGRATRPFRALLAFEVERTRAFFRTGLALAREVPEPFQVSLLLFIRGGWGILDRIERQRFDTLSRRPAWSRWEKVRLVWDTWRRRDRILAEGLG